jgi:hypothetical protein
VVYQVSAPHEFDPGLDPLDFSPLFDQYLIHIFTQVLPMNYSGDDALPCSV